MEGIVKKLLFFHNPFLGDREKCFMRSGLFSHPLLCIIYLIINTLHFFIGHCNDIGTFL